MDEPRPGFWQRALFGLTDLLGSGFVRLLGGTWRVYIHPPDGPDRLKRGELRGVFAFWHCHLLALLFAGRNLGFAVPVSEHRDGEYVARIMSRMGFLPVRGSATRGGLKVLRGMMRAAAEGYNPAITPDGPKGPRHAVLPGIVYLAGATHLDVIPLGISVSAKWVLPSWDRFEIPKPFARIDIVVGTPLRVPGALDRGRGEFDRGRIPEFRDDIKRLMSATSDAARRNPRPPRARPARGAKRS